MVIKNTSIIIIIVLLTLNICEPLSASSREYCESDVCNTDENEFDSNLTDEEAVNEYIVRYGVDRLDNFIKARLNGIDDMQLKIAITGASGSGKSMLINTFRGLNDSGAAALGSTETTMDIQRYSHPKKKNLKFYDLPGVGTPNFPKENYLKLVSYQKYDFFIIVGSNRFTEDDLWLSQEVKKYGKAFFFVRSKVDEDLVNERRDHPKTFNEEKVLKKIREESFKYISEIDPTANVFLISGLLENTLRFDYALMEQRLINSFPVFKRRAMIMSMTMTSKEGIKAKVAALKSMIWMIGILSGGMGAIPVPVPGLSLAIDYALISETISNYKNQLGLDDVSLGKFAERYHLSLYEISAQLTSGWMGGLLKNNVKQIVFELLTQYASEKAVKECVQFIPIVGLAIKAVETARITMAILNDSLNELSTAALSKIDLIKYIDDQELNHQ